MMEPGSDSSKGRPLAVRHFVDLLAHMEKLVEADLIEWNEQSSVRAQQRLDRLSNAVKIAAKKVVETL